MYLKSYGELSSGWVVESPPVLFVQIEFSFKRCLILVMYDIFFHYGDKYDCRWSLDKPEYISESDD